MNEINERAFSRDTDHQRFDLRASLNMISDGSRESMERIERVVAELDASGPHAALRLIALQCPAQDATAFGLVLRFHLEAQTSLMNDAEALSSRQALELRGLTVKDLGWPAKVLSGSFLDDAAEENPAMERALSKAIASWQAAVGMQAPEVAAEAITPGPEAAEPETITVTREQLLGWMQDTFTQERNDEGTWGLFVGYEEVGNLADDFMATMPGYLD